MIDPFIWHELFHSKIEMLLTLNGLAHLGFKTSMDICTWLPKNPPTMALTTSPMIASLSMAPSEKATMSASFSPAAPWLANAPLLHMLESDHEPLCLSPVMMTKMSDSCGTLSNHAKVTSPTESPILNSSLPWTCLQYHTAPLSKQQLQHYGPWYEWVVLTSQLSTVHLFITPLGPWKWQYQTITFLCRSVTSSFDQRSGWHACLWWVWHTQHIISNPWQAAITNIHGLQWTMLNSHHKYTWTATMENNAT